MWYNKYMEFNTDNKMITDKHQYITTKCQLPDINILYELSDFFKIMGDSTRLQLLWALEESELCVGELAELLNMTKSAVSHQLKVLKTAKLVRNRKDGKNVYYSLNDHHVKLILEKALEHICE